MTNFILHFARNSELTWRGMKQWIRRQQRRVEVALMRRVHYSRSLEFGQLVRWLRLQPEDRVLDIGCGDGFWTQRLVRYAGEVVGMDIDVPMVTWAGSAHNGRLVHYMAGGVECIPLRSGCCTALISICALEHFQDDCLAFSEMARVLYPGGRVALSCDSLSLRYIPESFRTRHRAVYAVSNYYTLETLRERMEVCGFRVLEYRYIINSRISSYLARLQTNLSFNPYSCLAAFLLLYPLVRLSDRFFGHESEGHKLLVLAERLTESGNHSTSATEHQNGIPVDTMTPIQTMAERKRS